MSSSSDSPLDRLWQEYSEVFRDFDDLTLARWLAQTLGQLEGRAWRLSHPLLGACRLAAQLAHDRQVWLKRLATPPAAYRESRCCRSSRATWWRLAWSASIAPRPACRSRRFPPNFSRKSAPGRKAMRRCMPSPTGMTS